MKDYGTESGICSIISGEEAAGAGQISFPAGVRMIFGSGFMNRRRQGKREEKAG